MWASTLLPPLTPAQNSAILVKNALHGRTPVAPTPAALFSMRIYHHPAYRTLYVFAMLALMALAATTGAFHEDGLADVADGFGGGRTIERKLEIMRDSRIGAYGGVALCLSLLGRWAALTALLRMGSATAFVALLAAAALSRWLGLLPMALLPPARKDGAAHAAMGPEPRALALGGALALSAGLAPAWLAGAGLGVTLAAAALALAAALGMAHLAKRQIGGQTGDVAGAAQQLAEIAFLITLCARI